jgi:hypothetical protein
MVKQGALKHAEGDWLATPFRFIQRLADKGWDEQPTVSYENGGFPQQVTSLGHLALPLVVFLVAPAQA